MSLSMNGLLNVQVFSRVRVRISHVSRTELVRAPASLTVKLRGGDEDFSPVHVERCKHAGFALDHGWLDPLQRLCGDEERPFHCAVIAPEPHGAAGRVVTAALIGKV